ncbi:M24 family metallopeptidase [Flavobacteriaceae bacterium AU392]|nr:M24 family metallopeptidase [Flavobacteriaceae bacterium]RKM85708.1 M24 family metallopeptidase [Flavobacteriaceae bacterium AU392]
MKSQLTFIIAVLTVITSFAQNGIPKDYLTKEFHKERREALRSKMEKNSVAVFFANPVRNRANDVEYVYHQDPNFYYLTGYKEPHAVLVIFSENQTNAEGKTYNEILYVQERNAAAEQWTGRRLGVKGSQEQLGFEMAFNGRDFKNSGITYEKFDKVMFNNFQNDYRDSARDEADLFSLVEIFKTQVNYGEYANNATRERIYELIKSTNVENSANVAQTIGRAIETNPELKNDKIINNYVNASDPKLRLELKQQAIAVKPKSNIDTRTLSTIMAGLRQIKTEEEMKLLTKAIRISAIGQREIMKAMHVNMSEIEIQGVHEFIYKKYGSEYEGYPSIVGAGENGCVLHYIENNKLKVENDLVLMDLGAEYHGYSADVTRTIPANGKFSEEQKTIYDLVYDAQEAGIEAARIGNSFRAPGRAASKVLTEGLLKLGIIKNANEVRRYFPHGTSHYLGLDVHDPGLYQDYEANMVITVEPGIYIPEGSPCDEKWWGIAVRIEDDILITENGPVNLSGEAPRKSEDIEALMKETSVLDGFKLPKLD